MKLTIKQKVITVIVMITIAILLGGYTSLAVSKAKVIVETANLREKASAEAKIVELISKGEEVEIVSTSGNWYQVSYKGITGYLRNDLVEMKEDTENNDQNSTSTNVVTNSENSTTNENNADGKQEQNNNQTSENQNNETENETQGSNQTGDVPEDTTKKEEPALTGKYKVITETKMKITPLITSLTLTTLSKDREVDVIKVMNQWAWVDDNGSQAWVYYRHLEKIEEQANEPSDAKGEKEKEQQPQEQNPEENKEPVTKTMYVNSQTVNVRKKADKTAELVTQLSLNTAVEVISEENGWSQIKVNGQTGYISSTLLSATKQQTSRGTDTSRQPIQNEEEKKQDTTSTSPSNSSQSNANTNTNNSGSASGSAVVAYANQFIGYPYVYGGTSPSGFDCSGFTSYVYRHFGVSLNRTAAAQASNGISVSKSNLQPGDLLFFCSPINHVGIYIGGGRMVHAANKTRGVTTDTINSGYYSTNYVGATRIFN